MIIPTFHHTFKIIIPLRIVFKIMSIYAVILYNSSGRHTYESGIGILRLFVKRRSRIPTLHCYMVAGAQRGFTTISHCKETMCAVITCSYSSYKWYLCILYGDMTTFTTEKKLIFN